MAGTVTVDTIQSSVSTPTVFKNTSGTEIGRTCRIHCNFSSATINASLNVSSITRTGTGDYDVNFSTALADTYWAGTTAATPNPGTAEGAFGWTSGSQTASKAHIEYRNCNNMASYDPSFVHVAFFR